MRGSTLRPISKLNPSKRPLGTILGTVLSRESLSGNLFTALRFQALATRRSGKVPARFSRYPSVVVISDCYS